VAVLARSRFVLVEVERALHVQPRQSEELRGVRLGERVNQRILDGAAGQSFIGEGLPRGQEAGALQRPSVVLQRQGRAVAARQFADLTDALRAHLKRPDTRV
jgi:hypothetical protein